MSEAYHDGDDMSHVEFGGVVQEQSGRPDWWESEPTRNGWHDTFTARKKVFPDGQMEISVAREKHFTGPALIRKPRAKRGESENREQNDLDAGKAAKQRVREACKTIGADRLVTLTFRENITDREQALKYWKEYCRRLRRVVDFHYVAVMEAQQRGAIHFHVAVRGRQDYFLLRSVWYSVLGMGADGKPLGQVNVRNPSKFGFGRNGLHKLAAYLAKYCTKKMEIRDLDQKRYFCSRGIPKPEVTSWRLVCDTMIEAVNVAYAIAAEGELDGSTWWCNNGLQCVWIATGPGRGGGGPVPF